MSDVFDFKKSVFFASDGSGAAANAGGCTRDWWDTECPNHTEAEHVAARDKMMDANGVPIVDVTSVSYTQSDTKFNVTGAVASGVEIGMLAYLYNATFTTIGMYQITDVGTDFIRCQFASQSQDDTLDIIIGGEFLLQDALDETDASKYDVEIHVRDDLVLTAPIDIDYGGGTLLENSFKKIRGYNISPNDMDLDGTYYESPQDILVGSGSPDATKSVKLDGDAGNFEVLDVAVDNVIIENIHCNNTGTALGIILTSTPQNVTFRNCRFTVVSQAYQSDGEDILFDSCFTSNNTVHNYVCSTGKHILLNCVAVLVANSNFVNAISVPVTVIGCTVAGVGKYGVHAVAAGASILVINNTFYNLASNGVYQNTGETAIIFNNIFCLTPGAIGIQISTTGAITYNDYNCFIETDGTALTVSTSANGEPAIIGAHSVTVDPQFMDAGNGDFRLRPISPCINSGKPQADGYVSMGAWNRISRIRR